MPQPRLIRIATRRSPLAQIQARQVQQALCAAHGWDAARVPIIPLKTRGDNISDDINKAIENNKPLPPLADIGGKGAFTEVFEQGLRAKQFDIAVHSLKDLPARLPDDLILACVPPRVDARDALILAEGQKDGLESLSAPTQNETQIGTSSLRRKAQILAHYPNMQFQPLRGNIETRLAKLQQTKLHAPKLHAIVLAVAGLKRLGMAHVISTILPPAIMLPAAGQGALGLQTRADDRDLQALLAPLHCPMSAACVTAERAFLAQFGGSCHMPIAAFVQYENNMLQLTARLLAEDGQTCAEAKASAPLDQAETLGKQIAEQIHKQAPDLVAALSQVQQSSPITK
ncbi:MAG: hydroxymethylbilane synthase [Alphaproteobacteria bacterium]|nr:hydroxymethylbilane synthase [Alphaproteobacteria bacterium]